MRAASWISTSRGYERGFSSPGVCKRAALCEDGLALTCALSRAEFVRRNGLGIESRAPGRLAKHLYGVQIIANDKVVKVKPALHSPHLDRDGTEGLDRGLPRLDRQALAWDQAPEGAEKGLIRANDADQAAWSDLQATAARERSRLNRLMYAPEVTTDQRSAMWWLMRGEEPAGTPSSI